jgi:hypothetical protein
MIWADSSGTMTPQLSFISRVGPFPVRMRVWTTSTQYLNQSAFIGVNDMHVTDSYHVCLLYIVQAAGHR